MSVKEEMTLAEAQEIVARFIHADAPSKCFALAKAIGEGR